MNTKKENKNMAPGITNSEMILEELAGGASFDDLQKKHGFTKNDLLTAALFGVAELREEYINLLKKYGRFKDQY